MIAQGDRYLKSKKYNEAIAAYQEAKSIKPGEAYPQNKIDEIDALVAAGSQARLEAENRKTAIDKKYKSAVANGNMSMKFKNFGEAKTFYTEASELKPDEQYPRDKLAEIQRLLDIEKRNSEVAAKVNYDTKIREADDAFSAREYALSKEKYKEALVLIPGKKYPEDKLLELVGLLEIEEKNRAEAAAKAKQLDDRYRAAIVKADDELASKNFYEAKRIYQAAMKLKPEEEYPKNQIDIVDNKIEEQRNSKAEEARRLKEKKAEALKKEQQKVKDKQYRDVLADADKAFRNRDLIALSLYRQASSIKPDEQYPKEKIAEINAIIDGNEKTDAKYDKELKEGAALLIEKKYASAIDAFERALAIKPSEEYPKSKIVDIREIVARNKSKEEATARAKAEADLKAKENAARKAEALEKLRAEKAKERLAEVEKAKRDKSQNTMDAGERARHIREMQEEAHKGLTDEERQRYLAEVALEYPAGLTEERYMDGEKKIVVRIIVEDGNATMFKKVLQPWGQTFYFKNGQNTTKSLWESESDSH